MTDVAALIERIVEVLEADRKDPVTHIGAFCYGYPKAPLCQVRDHDAEMTIDTSVVVWSGPSWIECQHQYHLAKARRLARMIVDAVALSDMRLLADALGQHHDSSVEGVTDDLNAMPE